MGGSGGGGWGYVSGCGEILVAETIEYEVVAVVRAVSEPCVAVGSCDVDCGEGGRRAKEAQGREGILRERGELKHENWVSRHEIS